MEDKSKTNDTSELRAGEAKVDVGTAEDGCYEVTVRIRPPRAELAANERAAAGEQIYALQAQLDEAKRKIEFLGKGADRSELAEVRAENQKLTEELENALRALTERSVELEKLHVQMRGGVGTGSAG